MILRLWASISAQVDMWRSLLRSIGLRERVVRLWSAREQAEALDATSQVDKALCTAGFPTTLVQVTSSDLTSFLSGYDPLEYIIFNWCESLPGVHHSESLVAEYLEQHDFTFTGAGSATLASAYDKCRVKRLLDEAGILTPVWELYDRVVPLIMSRA
jgi:D-alanine-D-alanine ligase-like ATP-grasp enzyme